MTDFDDADWTSGRTKAQEREIIGPLVEAFQRIDDACRDGELTESEEDALRIAESDKVRAQYGEAAGIWLLMERRIVLPLDYVA
jgi:hypothetical protein